jgi:hypothetical protein
VLLIHFLILIIILLLLSSIRLHHVDLLPIVNQSSISKKAATKPLETKTAVAPLRMLRRETP